MVMIIPIIIINKNHMLVLSWIICS